MAQMRDQMTEQLAALTARVDQLAKTQTDMNTSLNRGRSKTRSMDQTVMGT